MRAIAELSVADWHRLNRLLETGLGLEGEARVAWLSTLPAREADLLPLLEQLLSPKDLTETAQFAVPLPARAWAEAPVATEQAGQQLGPYRLERELGAGGMGIVWLAARADGAFERQVALKLPHAEWIDRGLAQRFARERAMLASLNHPNIAQLFDAGWSESGRPYLALEYVEGVPITAWRDQQAPNIEARLRLFVDVIRAVAHAHARLIVHRDLKPSNVLVTAEGQVKLLDFGIAKLLSGESTVAEETELTRMAGRALTPNYAAPEQILGQPISTAADIYALGVLLFELLSGERPYRLNRADVQRRAVLEEAIVHVDPPAPSAVANDKAIRHTLRGDLDAIVLKALKKAPEQRYETAAAFADDIERYLNRLPVHAQRASRAYRLRRFLVRNRFAVGAVSAVILALAVGLGVALWQAGVARAEAARATTIKDFVLSIIQQADPVASRQTREADVALLTTAEARIDKELEKQPEVALQMRRAIGAAYRNRGEYARASQVLRKGIEQARTTLPPDNLELLGAYVQIAEDRVIDQRSALTDLDAAIERLRTLGPSGQLLLADALIGRLLAVRHVASPKRRQVTESAVIEAYLAARATGDAGRMLDAAADVAETRWAAELKWERALPVLAEAREYAARSGQIDSTDPRWIAAMAWHGVALCTAGKQTEGQDLATSAVALARTHHGAESRAIEVALQCLAQMRLACLGDAKGAVAPMRESHAIAIKREPPGSINRAWQTMWLLSVLLAANQLDEIRKVLRETPMFDPTGSVSPALSWTGNYLRAWEVLIHRRLGDPETAESVGEEAVAQMKQEDADPSIDSMLFHHFAQALYENGKYARAESFELAALKELEKDLSDDPTLPSDRAKTLLQISRIRSQRANHQGALEAADQALALFSGKGAPSAGDQAAVNGRRGRALLGLGRYTEAVEALAAADAYWQTHGGSGEASYWYGKALIATGDTKRGEALVKSVLPGLAASDDPHVRALASREGVKPKETAALVRR